MALSVTQVQVRGFDENLAYIVANPATAEALIVDPSGDFPKLHAEIDRQGLRVVGILLTHTHPDHQDALTAALEAYQVPVFVHERGVERVREGVVSPVRDGDVIELGGEPISVLFTPGHNPDSVCYSFAGLRGVPQLITGDTLFVHGCGRTTEEGVRELYESLQRLQALPPETVVYPGHDYGPTPTSTIGRECTENKYLLAEDFPTFAQRRLGYTVEI
jgi:glyoxylase-like metal-dependent hydrolase (beta-lactamase superfamily II)